MDERHSGVGAGGTGGPNSPRPAKSLLIHLGRDGEFWVGLGVVGLGLFFLIGSLSIRVQPSYATIGPRFFPMTVGINLIACGTVSAVNRARTLLRTHGAAQAQYGSGPLQWQPFLLIAGALVVYILLLTRAGFIVSSALLFAVTAYGLGNRRVVRNAVVGLVFALLVYLTFTHGLGLYLPGSFLEQWLG